MQTSARLREALSLPISRVRRDPAMPPNPSLEGTLAGMALGLRGARFSNRLTTRSQALGKMKALALRIVHASHLKHWAPWPAQI